MDPPSTGDSAERPSLAPEPIRVQAPIHTLATSDSQDSQTAAEFINDQLQLEADAREAFPYAFDTCTQPLGALRQILFACLTCKPPPTSPSDAYTAAGVCYSCSIACHGEHTLVELFNKRNFVCDCGTKRLPSSSPCTLRINGQTGIKGGVHSELPAATNRYNQNFQNVFCGCEKDYDAYKEKGTMYQCLGLGTVEDGGCGEDWWHPNCVVGLAEDWGVKRDGKMPEGGQDATLKETNGTTRDQGGNGDGASADKDPPPPPGFPSEDDFEAFICYKCVDAYPWIKRYAGTEGFLPPVYKGPSDSIQALSSNKRKAEDETDDSTVAKKLKDDVGKASPAPAPAPNNCRYNALPPAPTGSLSLFLKASFRDSFCRCPTCYPRLSPHPQLLEEEDSYEPPLSESGDEGAGGSSVGTGSLLDRGERALSNVDRVRAIEGVMVYNHLKDKVKSFLQPFAETGQPVGAEDVKKYFEKLRGDAEAVNEAGAGAAAASSGGGDEEGDGRREQSGECRHSLSTCSNF